MAMTYGHDLLEIALSFNTIYTILKAMCQNSYMYTITVELWFLYMSIFTGKLYCPVYRQ
jgi:hypothetical protein